MLHEFIFRFQVYGIRSNLDQVNDSSEQIVMFRDLDSAQAFFREVAKDRFAREDLMNAAKWIGIAELKSNKTNDPEIVQVTLETLCLKIWAGDLLLVEITPAKVLEFATCCLKSIKAIQTILESAKILHKALLVSKLVILLFPNPNRDALVGVTSMAKDFMPSQPESNDWVLLARAMMSIPDITRNEVHKVARIETVKHAGDNRRELRKFWEGVMDATA